MRRLSSGVTAVVVAFLTSFVMVAHAPLAAASTVTPIPPELTKVGEAVRHAGPGVAARNATKATSLIPGPVGLVFKGISLGMTAFQTRDYWLPFVSGAIDGNPETSATTGPVGYVKQVNGITGVSTSSSGIPIEVVVTFTQALGNNLFGTVQYVCMSPSGSTVQGTANIGYPVPNAGTTVPTDRVVSAFTACAGSGAGWVISGMNISFYPPPSYHNAGTWEYQAGVTAEALNSTVTCRRPDGTTYTVTRTTTRDLTVQMDGTEWLQVAPCAPGDTPVNLNVQSSTGGTTKTIGDYPLSPTDPEHNQEYPQCADASCLYRIRVDGQSCTTGVEACTHWSYIWSQQAYRVECFYGPYSVAVDQCLFMERAYDTATGSKVGTLPNTDGDPATYTPPAPAPPRTTTTTSSSPSSSSTSSASPSVTPTPPPATGGQPQPTPPADPAGARCFPTGWAMFNPFEWVYKPVMCALRDAFVPDTALSVQRLNSVKDKLATRGPGPAIASVSAVVSQASGSGGCAGPAMPFSIGGVSENLHPFSACAEPMSTAAFYVKALATVVIVLTGGLSIVRAIGSGFGWSFSMGKGADDGV